MDKMRKVVTDAQAILAEYIVPDSGISDHECINRLLGLLDGQQTRDALATPVSEIERITTTEPEPGRIPDLHNAERHARYWTDGAKEIDDREEALLALHQAALTWKNAAYAMADQRDAAKRQACTSEHRTTCSFAASATEAMQPMTKKDMEYLSRLAARANLLRARLADTQLADTQEITKELHALDWGIARLARTA